MSNQKKETLAYIRYYRESIKTYRNKIALYDSKLQCDLSETKRKCYEKLKEVCEERIIECENNIRRLMSGGYGEVDFEANHSDYGER